MTAAVETGLDLWDELERVARNHGYVLDEVRMRSVAGCSRNVVQDLRLESQSSLQRVPSPAAIDAKMT